MYPKQVEATSAAHPHRYRGPFRFLPPGFESPYFVRDEPTSVTPLTRMGGRKSATSRCPLPKSVPKSFPHNPENRPANCAMLFRGVAVGRQKTPFENIEGALEYVTCLLDACRVAQTQVEAEIGSASEGR